MLNLLSTTQTRNADAYTIANKPVKSIDLMEAAASAFADCFMQEFASRDIKISIYCGTGNNGGDGLAIARLLKKAGYMVTVRIASFNASSSADFNENLRRLKNTEIPITKIDAAHLPDENAEVIIDALLGSGLNKPLEGDWLTLINYLNSLQSKVVAVDVPTGFMADGALDGNAMVLKSALVICFQRPKLNFFFPESAESLTRFKVVHIGLDEGFIQSLQTEFKLLEESDIRNILKPRLPFSHKGTYGHALIIAGDQETMGAALLCAQASLFSGAGLTTACIPEEGLTALNCSIPEVMALLRHSNFTLPAFNKYTAVAAGPGIGTSKVTIDLIKNLINNTSKPLVLDADALNILAGNKELLEQLPPATILTPHVKEFDRLFGEHANWWQRVETAKQQAKILQIIIILKNRYTFIVLPNQQVLINPTGSPCMATGGTGDVLTGMVTAFLAQGYTAQESAIIAVYVHGFCGERYNGYVMPASKLTEKISEVMTYFLSSKQIR